MECLRDIGWRCHALGHARFEEGSEHFFAYAFEQVTGRSILHGELVTLGVRREELEATLRRLPSFVVEQGLWYSCANEISVGTRELGSARRAPFVG